MTQTTSAISWRDCILQMSTSGSAWTDISGFANSVAVSGGDRDIGALNTMTGDTPILAAGKRNALDVTVKAAYTENASEPHVVATTAYETPSSLYLRWAPSGSSSGKKLFTTSAGIVKSPVYPQGGADSGDPVTVDITITVASITASTI